MNQIILQPPYMYVHYDQACRIRHNTKSSYETPLHHYDFNVLPKPATYPQPYHLVDPVHLVQ